MQTTAAIMAATSSATTTTVAHRRNSALGSSSSASGSGSPGSGLRNDQQMRANHDDNDCQKRLLVARKKGEGNNNKILLVVVLLLAMLDLSLQALLGWHAAPRVLKLPLNAAEAGARRLWDGPNSSSLATSGLRGSGASTRMIPALQKDINNKKNADFSGARLPPVAIATKPLEVAILAASFAKDPRPPADQAEEGGAAHTKGRHHHHHRPPEKCAKTFVMNFIANKGRGGLNRNTCRTPSGGYACRALERPRNDWKAPRYLADFAEEITYQRTPENGFGGDVVDRTFVGVIVALEGAEGGDANDACSDDFLDGRLSLQKGGKKEEWDDALQNPRVLCVTSSLPPSPSGVDSSELMLADPTRSDVSGNDINKASPGSKWSIEQISPPRGQAGKSSHASSSLLDERLQSTDVHVAIKDAVFIVAPLPTSGSGPMSSAATETGASVVMGALLTLARTRYLEFPHSPYHSDDDEEAGSRPKLSTVVDALDQLGFDCYFRGSPPAKQEQGQQDEGGDGLFRLTGCYQNFYDSHEYGPNVACINRRLAPQLTGRMEMAFRATVGALPSLSQSRA